MLIEIQYLPPVATFACLSKAESILLEAHEHYQKGSYRNRCHLAGANGLQRLSIPLRKGKNNQLPITEVMIAYDEPWHRQHWQSIRSAYSNSPYFEFYAPALKAIYDAPPASLWELNFQLLKAILKALRWDKELLLTEHYQTVLPSGVTDLRGRISPKVAVTDELAMEFPAYPQVFTEKHGFLPNLSILDLLFCQGPAATLYLDQLLAEDIV